MQHLTLRERETVGLIARGHTNRLIASKLGVTEGTVKQYVSRILIKLELTNRTEVAIWALNVGTQPDPRAEWKKAAGVALEGRAEEKTL